jgi:hypothetical protein
MPKSKLGFMIKRWRMTMEVIHVNNDEKKSKDGYPHERRATTHAT